MSCLLAAAVVLALLSNLLAAGPRKLAWLGSYSELTAGNVTPAPVPAPGGSLPGPEGDAASIAPPKDPALLYLEISGEVAERLHRAGALFIDARRTEAFERGHIGGATSIAVWEHDADSKTAALHGQGVKPDRVIVVYCSGKDCTDSKMMAEKLAMAGFFNLYVYEGGFPDWEKRGLPVARGKAP